MYTQESWGETAEQTHMCRMDGTKQLKSLFFVEIMIGLGATPYYVILQNVPSMHHQYCTALPHSCNTMPHQHHTIRQIPFNETYHTTAATSPTKISSTATTAAISSIASPQSLSPPPPLQSPPQALQSQALVLRPPVDESQGEP
jgi:hypothetical protein